MFTESKTDLVVKRGRTAEPNPYLDFIKSAVEGKTYEDVFTSKEEAAKAERHLRNAAKDHGKGIAIKHSEPNAKGHVKTLFKTQPKKERKPSDIEPPK